MDLSIDLPKTDATSTTLKACLDDYFNTEKMVDSGFKCKKCKSKVDIEKRTSIYLYPRVLILHLKRFK